MPPVRYLVAGFVGYKPPDSETKPMTRDEFQAMVSQLGGKIPGMGRS